MILKPLAWCLDMLGEVPKIVNCHVYLLKVSFKKVLRFNDLLTVNEPSITPSSMFEETFSVIKNTLYKQEQTEQKKA